MGRRESSIENSFVKYVTKNGDECIKVVKASWPDRLILFENQKFYFVELKREDEEPRPSQYATIERLKEKGFRVHWADCIEMAVWQYHHEKDRVHNVR